VKGKGLPEVGAWGKGDQFVRVDVAVPRSLSHAQKELLKRFSESN
jgi:molecular chaperone DnaJ